jgi:hypothetical protein
MTETFDEMMERIKREHPLIGTAQVKKPVLYRSKLIEYERRYGKPFNVTDDYEIIEDVSGGDKM